MTTEAGKLVRQAGDSPLRGGEIETYGERGVWVPDGLSVSEIMAGAAALERMGVDHYAARSMARAVLLAVRETPTA